MVRRLLWAALGFVLTRGSVAQELSPEQMRQDFDQLAAAVRSQWSYYEDRTQNAGLDLDALLAGTKAGLEGSPTRERFVGVLREFVAALRDGHADVQVPGIGSPTRRWPLRAGDSWSC